MKKTVEHLNSTVELWEHICKTADFKSKEYDKELLADKKKNLDLTGIAKFVKN